MSLLLHGSRDRRKLVGVLAHVQIDRLISTCVVRIESPLEGTEPPVYCAT